jgi:hypothetical protein
MVHDSSLKRRFWSRMRLTILGIVFSLLISLAACSENAPEVPAIAPRPTAEVIITAWTAEVIGELINLDGCIRIRDGVSEVNYAIVWTPDVSATIEGDAVRVISGIVSGNSSEVVLHFGELVRLSGGETTHPDEQLLENLPANCQGPYWVVGFEVGTVQTTEVP